MKKILVLFIMLSAVLASAKAERVVIFEGDNDIHLTVIPLPLTRDGVTLSIYGTVHPDGLFMYGGHQSSLTTQVGRITRIAFERQGSVQFSFSEGGYTNNGNNGYWTGNAVSVTFVPASSLVVHRIIVYVDDSGSGGQDDHDDSLTLCDVSEMQDGSTVTFGRELVTLWQGGSYLYVKDRLTDCYGLLYGNVGQTYRQGDVIPPGWTGKLKYYGGEPELTQLSGLKPAVESVNVEPEEIAPGEMNHEYWAHYVVFRNVLIDIDRNVLIDEDGNEIPFYNRTFNIPLPSDLSVRHDVYGIIGSYKPSGGDVIYQLLPTAFDIWVIDPVVCCIADLIQFSKGQTVQFECPLTVIYQHNAYLYVKDQCGEFGLIYGAGVGGPYSNGDLIIGFATWNTYQDVPQIVPVGAWELVGHGPAVEPEELPIDDLTSDCAHWYVIFRGVKIVTEEGKTYIEDQWGNRLLIYNRFQIELQPVPAQSGHSRYDVNGDGEVNIADINALLEIIISGTIEYDWYFNPFDSGNGEETYDVTGFLEMYRDQLEFTPISIKPSDTSELCKKGDANGDGEITIADINALIDYILSD